jgi:hypothetical protein
MLLVAAAVTANISHLPGAPFHVRQFKLPLWSISRHGPAFRSLKFAK